MLTDHGRWLISGATDRMLARLTAGGGPYAGLLTPDPDSREITEAGSGLLRQRVAGGTGRDMHVRWDATRIDDGIRVQWIGLAESPEGPFLFKVPVPTPKPENPLGNATLAPGDVVELRGPFRFTIS
jgi:hypothetical protein